MTVWVQSFSDANGNLLIDAESPGSTVTEIFRKEELKQAQREDPTMVKVIRLFQWERYHAIKTLHESLVERVVEVNNLGRCLLRRKYREPSNKPNIVRLF